VNYVKNSKNFIVANLILGICAIALGVAIIVVGQNTGLVFFRRAQPGTGFMPFLTAWGIILCGLALAVSSLIKFVKVKGTTGGSENDPELIWIFKRGDLWNFFVVIGASIMITYSTRFLGLMPSLAVGIVVITKLLGTPGWRTPILVGIFSWVMFYSAFDLFLGMPIPRGIFGF